MKIISTKSAKCMRLRLVTSLSDLKNRMLFNARIFVFLVSLPETLEYSHDLQAKNRAPDINCPNASFRGDDLFP